ncbi:MAG: PAS domain S-box protein [Gemmatimonadetes bacterium]|nr:PAS domain S-box protein [Gemmatimonadota bacterium]
MPPAALPPDEAARLAALRPAADERLAAARAALDALPIIAFERDERGACTFVNAEWRRVTGMTLADALGTGWLQGIHPDDRARLTREWDAAVARGETLASTYRYQRPDGSTTWVEGQACPRRDAAGRLLGYLGTAVDVGLRRQSEAALRVSEARLAHALEATEDGLWDWDITTGAAYFSRRWCEMLGYEQGQVKPTVSAWEELVHPEDLPTAKAALEAHFADQAVPYQVEIRLRRRDASWSWVLARGKVVEWTREGRPARMVGTHVDITRERQQASVLEASHAKLQGLFEVSPLALALADLDGTIVEANPAAHQITGYAPGTLRGRRLGELVTAESAPALWARVRALDAAPGGGEVEFELVRADGQCLPVRAQFARVVDEDGRARTWIVAQDLRASRQAEAALRESEARFRRMADQAPALIWMTDEAGRCTYVNAGWERFTGTAPRRPSATAGAPISTPMTARPRWRRSRMRCDRGRPSRSSTASGGGTGRGAGSRAAPPREWSRRALRWATWG